MNPLLDSIIHTLAHGEPTSALPWAPVVPHRTPRSAGLRRRVGTGLHGLAHRIEPQDTRTVEAAHYCTA